MRTPRLAPRPVIFHAHKWFVHLHMADEPTPFLNLYVRLSRVYFHALLTVSFSDFRMFSKRRIKCRVTD